MGKDGPSSRRLPRRNRSRREQVAEFSEIEFPGFGAGVEVEFAHAVGEAIENADEADGGHAAGVPQAEDVIGGANVVRSEFVRGGGAERAEDQRNWRAVAWLADEADESEGAGNELARRNRGRRMRAQIVREAEFGEALKLCAICGGGGECAGRRRNAARRARASE